ncbi:hypothetical protein protein [Bacillus cereus G9241]|nr:hypothetical protein protein [Bacillus cereus G9241]
MAKHLLFAPFTYVLYSFIIRKVISSHFLSNCKVVFSILAPVNKSYPSISATNCFVLLFGFISLYNMYNLLPCTCISKIPLSSLVIFVFLSLCNEYVRMMFKFSSSSFTFSSLFKIYTLLSITCTRTGMNRSSSNTASFSTTLVFGFIIINLEDNF